MDDPRYGGLIRHNTSYEQTRSHHALLTQYFGLGRGVQSTVISMSVCLSVCLSARITLKLQAQTSILLAMQYGLPVL